MSSGEGPVGRSRRFSPPSRGKPLGVGSRVVLRQKFGLGEIPVGTKGTVVSGTWGSRSPTIEFDPPYDKHEMKMPDAQGNKYTSDAQYVVEASKLEVESRQNPYTSTGKDKRAEAEAFAIVPLDRLKQALERHELGFARGPSSVDVGGKDGRDVAVYGHEPILNGEDFGHSDVDVYAKGRLIGDKVYLYETGVTGERGFAREVAQEYIEQSWPELFKELEKT